MKRRPNGFSMLEVLVALIVIALGLLGIVGMQAAAISNTTQARNRSLAAMTAQSLAAAMHANEAYWSALTASGSWSVSTGTDSSGNTTVSISGTPTLSQSTDCAASGTSCTAIQMAGYDMTQWASGTLSNKALPGATSAINCNAVTASTPVACTISVSWTEKNSAINTASVASGTVTQSYQLVMQP